MLLSSYRCNGCCHKGIGLNVGSFHGAWGGNILGIRADNVGGRRGGIWVGSRGSPICRRPMKILIIKITQY